MRSAATPEALPVALAGPATVEQPPETPRPVLWAQGRTGNRTTMGVDVDASRAVRAEPDDANATHSDRELCTAAPCWTWRPQLIDDFLPYDHVVRARPHRRRPPVDLPREGTDLLEVGDVAEVEVLVPVDDRERREPGRLPQPIPERRSNRHASDRSAPAGRAYRVADAAAAEHGLERLFTAPTRRPAPRCRRARRRARAAGCTRRNSRTSFVARVIGSTMGGRSPGYGAGRMTRCARCSPRRSCFPLGSMRTNSFLTLWPGCSRVRAATPRWAGSCEG